MAHPFDDPFRQIDPAHLAGPATGTGTPEDARDHARSQAGTVVECMPTLPASAYRPVPVGIDADALVWAERVAGGGYTHKVVAAGTTVRLTDLDGDACAHLLLFRAGEPWERLNVADTVKVQWQAYLGEGSLLLSDQGRVLATVVSDTSGHHDSLCGGSSRARNESRYGSGSPHGPSPAARELFLLAAAKHGLGARDLPPCCSLFKGVRVDPDSGALEWTGSRGGPATVELRAELPLVVLVANTAHPLDVRATWSCGTLEVLAWPGPPTAPHDWPATRSPEAERAFRNNAADTAARIGMPA
jgi:urea carboxylase-associated protein 2